MKSPCWALLAGLAAFLLTGATYQDKRTLQNEIEYIERNMYKAEKIGAKLTRMTPHQADYINIPVEGPYKPEHYRY